MSVDPAFKGVVKGKSGFYIWRMENMSVVSVPREQYGSFYEGDSYIVLSVAEMGEARGTHVKIKDTKGPLDCHIHFWLGSETSQDEAGVAAYKSVELDDYLGGAPVQHREVEGSESKLFSNYFKAKGVRYLKGGVKSGFNHVEHIFKQRLLHVKGKHHVRVREIPIDWMSMNAGDVYILDLGNVLFVWVGKDSSRTEKIKGMEHARNLRDERGKANIVVIEDGEEGKLNDDEKKLFECHLPIKSKQLKSAEEGGADDDDAGADRKNAGPIKLYVMSEEEGTGTLKVSEVKSGPLSRKDLDSSEAYIIDNGEAGIWAWIGKTASKLERKEAMKNTVGFIKKKGLPSNTKSTRAIDGGEPTDFKALFKCWPQPPMQGKVYSQSRIAKTVQTKFDAATLHQNHQLAAETQMVDDGREGSVEVWRIEDFDMKPLEKQFMGQFFGGDCYIILYTYLVNKKENYLIYYWQGNQATTDELGTSALKAVELDDKLGGAPVQVRVVQGKEPPHFLAMFEGKMIVFTGGKAGWSGGEDKDKPSDTYMLQVRGTSSRNTKGVEVEFRASSLNSNDVFVIFSKKPTVYIWAGKGSTGDEREMAKSVASRGNREHFMVVEGQEKEDFWKILGGKEPYASEKRLQEEDSCHPARLFQMSNASGNFSCEEIPDFKQQDFVTDDIMLLDTWDVLYVWIGEGSNKQEKDEAETLAFEYIKTDPSGRDPSMPVYKVKQGHEPPTFTGFCGVWNHDMWANEKSYEEMSQELGQGNEALVLVKERAAANGSVDFNEVAKYTVDKLSNVAIDDLPSGVDASCKEIHLSNEDFESLFKMKYSDFITKPGWKQQALKKSAGMF